MLDAATYNGRPVEGFHDQQLRFRFAAAADGAIEVTADSPPAQALLESSEHGDRARTLAAGVARAARGASGHDLDGVVFSLTTDAHAAAILEARRLDPLWVERAAGMTLGELEATVDGVARQPAAARDGWILMGEQPSKRWRNFAQGAAPENVMLDTMPHVVAHEALHLDPATHLLDDPLPVEEGFVDFRARDPRLLRSTADALGMAHVTRPIVSGDYGGHVSAVERLFELAGRDVRSTGGREALLDSLRGVHLENVIEDSLARIVDAQALAPSEEALDEARYLVAHATDAGMMDAAVAALRVAR